MGGVERFVDELPDGAGTGTALRAAAETTIDIACGAACHSARGGPHFMFAQDVAGTDNHYKLWRSDSIVAMRFLTASCTFSKRPNVRFWSLADKSSRVKINRCALLLRKRTSIG